MPWQLTTAVDVGELDANDYTHVRIARMTYDVNRTTIFVEVEYGRVDGENWVGGLKPVSKQTSFQITGEDLDTLINDAEPNAGPPIEKTYDAVKRGLYTWLNANGHIAAGAVV